MLKLLGKWLKIYEDEIGLFLWIAALLFIVRSSGILLNNYAETAFLKRYGVEYLPIVNMINAVATFFIMGVMAGIMGKLPGARLLFYLFLFCGMSVAGIRFLIPFGIDLIYPVLFMLKAQYEVLLALLFWNLANDLFNTRQSKRLFPLVTAGGVIGQILGSFGTPFMVRMLSFDNLLFAYLTTCVVGAVVVKGMGAHFPSLLLSAKKSSKTKSRTTMMDQFRNILPLMKESMLIKILILLTFIPNVVIPIMNYQFNYAVNEQFATETSMIQFFSYFRGVLNIISLIILLFVGRIYGRWGLPVALMFHPFNYVLAFLAFLFRFDYFSAMYARMSSNILRTTINIPANAILMGLFPEAYRGMIRPFLRGTVVRIGLLLGSGMILFSEPLFHPRYLSLVALPFVVAWMISPFILKKNYAKILLDLVSRNMLDLKNMEAADVGPIFKDKKIEDQLVQEFLATSGDNCLWYARLLKSLSLKDLDRHILARLSDLDEQTRIELLGFLSPQAGKEALAVLEGLVDPEKPDLMVAIIKVANRLDPAISAEFDLEAFEASGYPEVKAYAVVGLFQKDPQKYREMIAVWLNEEDIGTVRAGIIAAGESGETAYVNRLKEILRSIKDTPIIPSALRGLHRLGASDLNELTLPYLSHPLEEVRQAALEVFDIKDDDDLKRVIPLMGDPSEQIHDKTKIKIESAPYQNGQLLVESINIPQRKIREGLFDLLEALNIKDIDAFRFARSQVESGYIYLAETEGLRQFPEGPVRNLLIDHLDHQKNIKLENTLRVLAAQDRSGQMRIIWRGVFSSDTRQKANSYEALDDLLDAALSKIMVPLLENTSLPETLAVGRKHFSLPGFDADRAAILSYFLAKQDWLTVSLSLSMSGDEDLKGIDPDTLTELTKSENTHLRQVAYSVIEQQKNHSAKKEDHMGPGITISDKILHLKGIEIFEGLSVSELAAVASVTKEAIYPPGEIVIKEGDPGETMYLVISGEVSVLKSQGEDHEIELDRIGGGDYFGEMALFEDTLRSATIRTEQESRCLVLHKQEFKEIVREYPQIALHICKILGGRIRKLHEKIQGHVA